MMKQQNAKQLYESKEFTMTLQIQQSGDSQLILGKVHIQPHISITTPTMLIELKGIYKIWNATKKYNHNSTQSNIDISQTLNDIQIGITKRQEQISIRAINSSQQLERSQYFMQGMRKITKLNEQSVIQANSTIMYPFVFNIPQNSPPSHPGIWFAGKRIQIRYYLIIKCRQQQSKKQLLSKQFQIKIRQSAIRSYKDVKFSNLIIYRCFACCCKYLGNYHVQISANVLHAGQIQVEGRVFNEGKKTEPIVSQINIKLMGEIVNVRKVLIAQKNMLMRQNQYEMLDGEVLISYDSDFKSFQSQLFTIRFWLQCKIQFDRHIWKLTKKIVNSEIEL